MDRNVEQSDNGQVTGRRSSNHSDTQQTAANFGESFSIASDSNDTITIIPAPNSSLVDVSTQTSENGDGRNNLDQNTPQFSDNNGSAIQASGSQHDSVDGPRVSRRALGLTGSVIATQTGEQVRPYHELASSLADMKVFQENLNDNEPQCDTDTVITVDVKIPRPEICTDVEVFREFVVLCTSRGLRKTSVDDGNVIETLKIEGAYRICKIRNEDNLVAVLVAQSYITIVKVGGKMSSVYCLVLEQPAYSDICHIDTYIDRNARDNLQTRHVFAVSYSARHGTSLEYTDMIDLVCGKQIRSGKRRFRCPDYDFKLHQGKGGISFPDVKGIYGMASDRYGYLFFACSYRLVYVNVYKKNIIWQYQYPKSPSDVSCCGNLVAVCVQDEGRIELRKNVDGELLPFHALSIDQSLQPQRISVNEGSIFLKVVDQSTWKYVILPRDITTYSKTSTDG